MILFHTLWQCLVVTVLYWYFGTFCDGRNVKQICYVEEFRISVMLRNDISLLQTMLFCCKNFFVAIYAVLSQNLFCRDLRVFCVEENLTKNCACGESRKQARKSSEDTHFTGYAQFE